MRSRALDLRIWIAAWRIGWALQRGSLKTVARELVSRPLMDVDEGLVERPADLAARIDRVVRRWSMPLAGACLVRSLLLYSLLRPHHRDLELVLGFDLRAGRRSARGHAWLRDSSGPLRPEDGLAAGVYSCTVVVP